jgi:gamma-polyglutamate biosynthesis protein CapC
MEPQTVAIGLGLVVSLLFTEAFGLAAGRMIVPGYFALQFHRPLDVAVTLLVAFATYVVVFGISKFAIVYGRRRIVLMMLVGFLLGHVVRTLLAPEGAWGATAGTRQPVFPGAGSGAEESVICVIGYIVPGLIALWFDRQGTLETVGTVLATSAVVRLCLIVLGMEVLQ